jgi:hypothetical protein
MKTEKNKLLSVGLLKIKSATNQKIYSFLDYIFAGTTLNIALALDLSTKNIQKPQTLKGN